MKDDALPIVISQMPRTNGIWAHTAGSVPLNVFFIVQRKIWRNLSITDF